MQNSPQPTTIGFKLYRDERRRLIFVDAHGQQHVDVEPVRCFPISSPDRWIAICDEQGHELTHIQHLTQLDPPLRQTLEEELAGHEFVPVVQRVVQVTEESDCCRWDLETDRGSISFQTNDENVVRRLNGSRVMLLGQNGIRYLIPDIAALDRNSRRLLEQYL
jgi:hypothetical protein